MPYKDPEAAKAAKARHYQKNKALYQGKAQEQRRVREQYVFDLKSVTPCVDCNVVYHPCQMQYDHISDDKVASVSDLIRYSTLGAVKLEISKCELVCSNCHSMRTWLRKSKHILGP